MHTTRSDGSGSVADIKATALSRGLNAVVVTDHCGSLTKAEWDSLVAETEAASEGSFLALPPGAAREPIDRLPIEPMVVAH